MVPIITGIEWAVQNVLAKRDVTELCYGLYQILALHSTVFSNCITAVFIS